VPDAPHGLLGTKASGGRATALAFSTCIVRALPALPASFRITAQGEVLRRLAGVAGGGSAIGRSLWQPQVRVLHRSLAVGLPRREQNVGPVGFGPPPPGCDPPLRAQFDRKVQFSGGRSLCKA